MDRQELYKIRYDFFHECWDYECSLYTDFDYKILKKMMYCVRSGRSKNKNTVNDCIIMADTETSKSTTENYINYVVAWTISMRAYDMNICTLYGNKPSQFIECLKKIIEHLPGHDTIIYFHNLAYDWQFIRQYMFDAFGIPENQLNVKSHYPINISFVNGIILKDSLILAQRSLEKWGKDMQVEHQKAVGRWNYDEKRTQKHAFTAEELEYIEHDTLAGIECIQKLLDSLNKKIITLPYTATGIPREEVRKRGHEHGAKDLFNSVVVNYEQQIKLECCFHGGFTHSNRHILNTLIDYVTTTCYDFASSYPFVLLSEMFPMEKFTCYRNCTIDEILKLSNKYAFMFKLVLVKPRLITDDIVMPALQFSKCTKVINPVLDNGRILTAAYAELYITEQDLSVLAEQYTYDEAYCIEVEYSRKDYLPRWFTDYIFELFTAKTYLKDGDQVAYNLAKAKLNSLYGMTVQHPIKETIEEDYDSGNYSINTEVSPTELYEKYVNSYNSILPYQWGVWVTAYAFKNLFTLGSCCENWYYSDTDSCYGSNWNKEKLEEYNNNCKQKLINNGYGPVTYKGRDYWLGIAELDGEYKEFKTCGAKRYACRKLDDTIKITVAGVPKKNGSKCLNNDLNNFKPGLIFDGITTGKKTHTYYYNNMYIDAEGNEVADCIDLTVCDYLLDSVNTVDWEKIYNEEIQIQTYEEE